MSNSKQLLFIGGATALIVVAVIARYFTGKRYTSIQGPVGQVGQVKSNYVSYRTTPASLDRLATHGPFIQPRATSDYLCQEMNDRGVEVLKPSPADRDLGSFVHRYPSHTLFVGFGTRDTIDVEKYTGDKIICTEPHPSEKKWDANGLELQCPMDTDRTKYEYRSKPLIEYMNSVGFDLVDEWEDSKLELAKGTNQPVPQNYNVIFSVYKRRPSSSSSSSSNPDQVPLISSFSTLPGSSPFQSSS